MRKKKAGLLVLPLLLIFQLSGFSWAVIYRPGIRDTRPWLPWERITRSAALGLSFEDTYLKKEQRHYSFLIQEYSLGLQGPLISPLFGSGSLNLSYGQRNLTSKLPDVSDAQQLYYSFRANLLPPQMRRFVSLSVNLQKTDLKDYYQDIRSLRTLTRTVSQVNLAVTPPALTLGGNNRGNRSRNNNQGMQIPLPAIYYTYSKSRDFDKFYTQQEFHREQIIQNYRGFYNLSPLTLEMSHLDSKVLNPLTREVLSTRRETRGEAVLINPINLSRIGIASVISRTKYDARKEREANVERTLWEGVSNTNEIISKSVTFLKITSNLNYTNTNSYDLPSRSGQIGHSLSLNSGYPLPLRGLSLNNQVGYNQTSPFPVGEVSESISENIGLNYNYHPLAGTDVSAWAKRGFTWVKKGDKTATEDYGGQIYKYFGNWAFLFVDLSYTASDNLIKKEALSRIVGSSLRFYAQPHLLLAINGNNNRKNGNGIFNLTDFSSFIEYQFEYQKDLLASLIRRWRNELFLSMSKGLINNHLLSVSSSMRWQDEWELNRVRREALNLGLSSKPFNDFLTLGAGYAESRAISPECVSISRGVNLSAESRFQLIHRLNTLARISHTVSWNGLVKKGTDISIGSEYIFGLTTFNLNWNLYSLGNPEEYHTFVLRFLRNF